MCQALLRDDVEAATRAAGRLKEIFGPDHLYVELQDHGIADQIKANRHLIEIARHLNLPLLATNDSHYTHREDAVAHDALLCVQTGAQVDDPKRFKFEGSEHYLKSSAEMRALFAEAPEACDNTLRIAERVDVEIEFGKPELPRFTVPSGSTEDEYLRELTFEGPAVATARPSPTRWPSGSTTSWASSTAWACRRTSWWCGTSSTTPAARASGWARAGARRPGAAWPTACRSSTSTRSATG